MKILLYYEPSFFGDGILGTSSYKLIVDHLYGFTGRCLVERPDVEFRLVVSEAAAFANAGTHLLDRLNPVTLTDEDVFSIAGADRKWHFAAAKIDGETVVVSAPEVKAPVAVRYAFRGNPMGDCNLYNREGLPASPFRTDDWEKRK